jgi:N-acyl amino acid synthase of PEP-CTERM/exosortase system
MHHYPAFEERRPSPTITNPTLSDAYNHWFEVVPAGTPALLEQAYRLRYQVYCREHDFETPDEHPHQRETDEFDDSSVHSLLVNRASGTVAGTVRLILPDHRAPESSFPIQRICSHPLLADRRLLLTSTAAEISRFAISKEFRKISNHSTPVESGRHGEISFDRHHLIPSITLGLLKATLQMSFERGITDWFAVMEPPLLRLLARFGIYFKPIGPLVEYHGLRQPCHANVSSLLDRVQLERYDVWAFVTDEGNSLQDGRKTFIFSG